MATAKIELSHHEIGLIWNALRAYVINTEKAVENLQSNKKIKKKDKEDLIKELLEEKKDVDKLAKFFNNQIKL